MKFFKKKRLNLKIAAIIISIILISSIRTNACTSYVVYSSNIYYGMNFDYPDVVLLFTITQTQNFKIFQAFFIQNGDTSVICGMNSGGLFSSIQMLYPQLTSWPAPQPTDKNLYDAYLLALYNSSDLQTALSFINLLGIKVKHIPGYTLHDFFADKNKNAYVLEVGENENLITPIQNNFMVMTNFSNYDFAGKPLDQISGAGADRYKTAYEYIEANKDTFTFNNGIETLQKTIQTSGDYKTQVSFLFDPINNEVYIALKRDFTKIWKVSIGNETIETYAGFNQYTQIPITAAGISSTELLNFTSVQSDINSLPEKFALYQNYPNPFNPTTTINYSIPFVETRHASSLHVELKVYNILGNEVAELVNEYKQPGKYTVQLSAFDFRLSSGIYFYRLRAGTFIDTKKFVLLK